MGKQGSITEYQEKYAVDLAVTLAAEEIAARTGLAPADALKSLVLSGTGKLLYDASSKLWCSGPAYIADMYMEEKGVSCV